jgi:hypothetical protein
MEDEFGSFFHTLFTLGLMSPENQARRHFKKLVEQAFMKNAQP